ncbi:MAG TPA: tetratricopeptide repeat protein [Chitinophagaceae bacterium]|nr:tetratricopeptide repeat protein [Chitinophagaceae bacterium]
MRTLIVLFFACASFFSSYAQEDSITLMLRQGIALHDQHDYEGAIRIYDEVIRKAPDHFLGYYEKSLSLLSAGRYAECIDISKEILKKFPKHEELVKVYINYGTAVDNNGDPEGAIKIYTQGIKKFNDQYLLHYNRAVTYYTHKDYEKAMADLKKSVSLNPRHASSHQLLAYSVYRENKIAGVLALSGFLMVEPTGSRAVNNLKMLNALLNANVEKTDDKTINITLSADALKPSKKEDDFGMAEMMVSMTAALENDEKFKMQNPAQKLQRKLESIVNITDENKKKDKGFFKNFYLPLLRQMKDNNTLEAACYIMYASSNEESIKKWLEEHYAKVEELDQWLRGYKWVKD